MQMTFSNRPKKTEVKNSPSFALRRPSALAARRIHGVNQGCGDLGVDGAGCGVAEGTLLVAVEAAEAGGGAGAGDAAAGAGVADAGAEEAGLGAETPAVLEPRPSFWRLEALILPEASMPLAAWNFCMAAMVLASHLPVGWP